MKAKTQEKKKAVALRKKGYSFKEISEILNISKSTASLWLRDIELSSRAIKRIERLGEAGRAKAKEANWKKRTIENEEILLNVERDFLKGNFSKFHLKVACALLYWGEGTKYNGNSSVSFMNADPEMISYFLYVFRKSFKIDEKKFRALVHLHEYHNKKKQLKFWSQITKIPISQFNKSYLKKNTGKNKRKKYPGCISIRYGDVRIYKELMFIINELIEYKTRG